jgi:hypothetical protein
MKRVFAALCVLAVGLLSPTVAMCADCHPACGQGQVCCVMQYSNGTYSSPYCKSGNSCYTSFTKQSLKNAKELDAGKLDLDKLSKESGKDAKAAEKSKSNK